MARGPTPTLRRRQLGTRFRELRQQAGMTVDDVANRLMVSPAKVSRIETGARGVSLRDVRDLCTVYAVDADEREQLMGLARQSHERSWWQKYDLPFATFIGLEAAAASISDYESSLIPGLLQTEDYARALLDDMRPDLSPDARTQRVAARMTRQLLLTGDQPPQFWAAIDEAALRRTVGGKAVMRAQLRVLSERAGLPNVTLQVIPFEVGAHPGLDNSFILLHFEETVSDVVFVEGLYGDLYLETPGDLERYRRVFDQIRAIALGPRESSLRIGKIADSFGD